MIKVTVIDDKRIIESVCDAPTGDTRLAWAQEGLNNLGYMIFTAGGELMYAVDKDNIFELLVRAALNHLDLKGVENAYSKNSAMFPGLYLLGFKKNEDRLQINIKEFFSVKPCCGK